jgi:hypothetical protein
MNAFVLGAVLGAVAVLVPLLIRLHKASFCPS